MALEATGRSYEAQDIYKVLRRSKNSSIKGQAKRLAVFGSVLPFRNLVLVLVSVSVFGVGRPAPPTYS